MDKLDQMIAEALAEEDREIMAQTDELGFFAQFARQLSGRNSWVNWAATVAVVAYMALALWSGWQCYVATDAVAAVKWGFVAAVSVVVIGMFKLYLFQGMQTDRVMRELKRVELMLLSREK